MSELTYVQKRYKQNPESFKKHNLNWRKNNPDKFRVIVDNYTKRKKLLVLKYYSGGEPMCKCCGQTDIRMLQLDHINDDGATHRKLVKGNSFKMYRWAIKNNFPPIFQVLCANCNIGKSICGCCPHIQPFNDIDVSTRKRDKMVIFNHYCDGDIKCACCGEKELIFLQLDHINGGGNIQRKQLSGSISNSNAVFRWIINNDFPPGYQVLCANHNIAKQSIFN